MSESPIRSGSLFIISAPSGAGKTTLIRELLARNPELVVSVSHTTRSRRPHEVDGQAYYFVDKDVFRQMVAEGAFLEHAQVFDCYYGTSRAFVDQQLTAGNDVLLEIDWQGARQVREKIGHTISLFILPPSFHSLEQRLGGRGEQDATVRRRMQDAGRELSHYHEYDYLIINDKLDVAVEKLEQIVTTARYRYRLQQHYFDDFVAGLLEQAGNIQ